jgi:hypothetical protein
VMFLHMTPFLVSQADARDTGFPRCLISSANINAASPLTVTPVNTTESPRAEGATIVHRGGSGALPPVTTSTLVPQGAD